MDHSIRDFSPQYESYCNLVRDSEVYKPLNHITIPLIMELLILRCVGSSGNITKKGNLDKGNVPGFFSSVQNPFIGYLVCDSQRLAPEIEE